MLAPIVAACLWEQPDKIMINFNLFELGFDREKDEITRDTNQRNEKPRTLDFDIRQQH